MENKSSFTEVLLAAKAGDSEAITKLFRMYKPLLTKNAMIKNVFDDDLYQELCEVLLVCIRLFVI